jgi:hypothetical protein
MLREMLRAVWMPCAEFRARNCGAYGTKTDADGRSPHALSSANQLGEWVAMLFDLINLHNHDIDALAVDILSDILTAMEPSEVTTHISAYSMHGVSSTSTPRPVVASPPRVKTPSRQQMSPAGSGASAIFASRHRRSPVRSIIEAVLGVTVTHERTGSGVSILCGLAFSQRPDASTSAPSTLKSGSCIGDCYTTQVLARQANKSDFYSPIEGYFVAADPSSKDYGSRNSRFARGSTQAILTLLMTPRWKHIVPGAVDEIVSALSWVPIPGLEISLPWSTHSKPENVMVEERVACQSFLTFFCSSMRRLVLTS